MKRRIRKTVAVSNGVLTTWLLASSLGCGGAAETAGHAVFERTSGAEMPHMVAVPLPEPVDPSEVASHTGPRSGLGRGKLPSIELLPPPLPSEEEKYNWETPEAESGTPLPPRNPMNAAARQHYEEGLAAARVGDYRTATTAFRRAMDADPKAREPVYSLGVVSDRQGHEAQARQYYEHALKLQPDYELALSGIAAIHFRQRQAVEAVAYLQPFAARWERNLSIQAAYADALTRAGRLDEAESVARSALRRDERFVPAMLVLVELAHVRGRSELAESILDQAAAIQSDHPVQRFLQGRLYEEQGRLSEALRAYQQAVELRADYAEARMALGLRYMASGNYQLALHQFEAVEKLSPQLVAVHLNLGDAYRALRSWEPAKAAFDRALRLQPQLPAAHYNLGLMYMAAGDEFPSMDMLQAAQRAVQEFQTYRSLSGPASAKDDTALTYIADLERTMEREKRRLEREARMKQQEAERSVRQEAAQ